MPEDLVCKFPRCISVGSWRDPWRINGPARMKGRRRGGGGSGRGFVFSVSSPTPLCAPEFCLCLPRMRICVRVPGCSCFVLRSARFRSPNKRSVCSRAGLPRVGREKEKKSRTTRRFQPTEHTFRRRSFDSPVPRSPSRGNQKAEADGVQEGVLLPFFRSRIWPRGPHINRRREESRYARTVACLSCESRVEWGRGAKGTICRRFLHGTSR